MFFILFLKRNTEDTTPESSESLSIAHNVSVFCHYSLISSVCAFKTRRTCYITRHRLLRSHFDKNKTGPCLCTISANHVQYIIFPGRRAVFCVLGFCFRASPGLENPSAWELRLCGQTGGLLRPICHSQRTED